MEGDAWTCPQCKGRNWPHEYVCQRCGYTNPAFSELAERLGEPAARPSRPVRGRRTRGARARAALDRWARRQALDPGEDQSPGDVLGLDDERPEY